MVASKAGTTVVLKAVYWAERMVVSTAAMMADATVATMAVGWV